jgi:MOSC domain-containing protein YiiM
LCIKLESYRFWQNKLGRNDFAYGQFGENFTVDGLSDTEVYIGDRYRIGGALFEVTQSRVTCYRLVLLRHETFCLVGGNLRAQQGHRGRARASATISR